MSVITARDLYDRDFFEWTRSNAALLRAGQLDQADLEHIAEEIEDMGKSQRRALESRLEVLLAHLLKWQFQPGGRGSSWESSIRIQRSKIEKLFRQMPSLGNALSEDLPDAYRTAVLAAVGETGLPKSSFPETCPFTIDQILDEEFFPE